MSKNLKRGSLKKMNNTATKEKGKFRIRFIGLAKKQVELSQKYFETYKKAYMKGIQMLGTGSFNQTHGWIIQGKCENCGWKKAYDKYGNGKCSECNEAIL